MVSRRNFFSICIMMAVILFMFQFLQIVRDAENNYDVNPYLTEPVKLSGEDAWQQDAAPKTAETVVYVGDNDSTAAEIIGEWAVYTKRRILKYGSLEEYGTGPSDKPILLCVSGSDISTVGDVNILSELLFAGQPIVLCDLPDVRVMERLDGLREILGIREIVQESSELVGVKMFSGFLLGGEVIYRAENEKEQQMQDLQLNVPWYLTLRSTKCYMVGMLEDTTVENEFLPPIIWRSSYGNSQIFAINGPYMYDQTGLGILNAIVYELKDYELHPVVNAQNLSIVNYPSFAVENTEKLMGIYARNLSRLQMDLMWPSLIACANKSNYKMTCFMTPQLDYSGSEEFLQDELAFYLKQFNEQEAEAGLSLDSLSGISVEEKAERDAEFYSASVHKYGSAYLGNNSADSIAKLMPNKLFSDIRTVTRECGAAESIISYCTDTVTSQGITANGFEHTYTQDLRIRSLETAIGYSNILLDMRKITWPEGDETQYWEVLFEVFSSNINTYWNAFSDFDKTTLAESDERVRSFLSLDYSHSRSGNEIDVKISNRSGDVWFLLRTHSESVCGIVGGDYEKIEDGAYLICAHEDEVKIEVESDNKMGFELP